MQIQDVDFEQFSRIVRKQNKKMIIWGIGTFFHTCMPSLLKEHKLDDQIAVLIDGDQGKWKNCICLNGKEFAVQSPEIMQKEFQEHVLLITSSYFADIVEYIDTLGNNQKLRCFIAPFMFRGKPKEDFRKYKSCNQQIPKVIHYCWFGKQDIPEKNKRCIESWKKYCPDYEIIEWNESNYDLKKNRYMYQAYRMGKYGYVPDYARIDLLYHYGGVYFDTDVELIKNIDELLYLQGFTSFEEYPMVNFGGGSGSIKGLGILGEILKYREKIDFIDQDGGINLLTCGFYETSPLLAHGLKIAGHIQNVEGLTVLTSDYFHVKSSVTKEIHIKECTFGVHDFNWSWVTEKQKEEQKRTSEFVKRYFVLE